MVYDFLDGNIDKARKMQLNVLPLINSLFSEVNPIPVKYALNELGFNFGVPRLPLVEFSDNNKKVLRQYLKNDYYI